MFRSKGMYLLFVGIRAVLPCVGMQCAGTELSTGKPTMIFMRNFVPGKDREYG